MSKRRGFPGWSLLGAVMFLPPGLVTWSFAEGEASNFTNDWVYISTPLLVLGFACVGLFLRRWMGALGLLTGAVVGLATIGALMFLLSGSIEERLEWRAQMRRLGATESFCAGGAAAHPDALAYNPAAPNATVVFSGREGALSRAYGDAFRDWTPEIPRVDQTALVACIVDRRDELEVCEYSGGRMLHRVRLDRTVQLYALSKGRLLAETEFTGGVPTGCQMIEQFYGTRGDNVTLGSTASEEDVLTFLRPHVGR